MTEPVKPSVWLDLRAIVMRVVGESKRVAVYAYTITALSALLIALVRMEAPPEVLLTIAGGITGTTTVGLPFLMAGVTRTDLEEAKRETRPHAA